MQTECPSPKASKALSVSGHDHRTDPFYSGPGRRIVCANCSGWYIGFAWENPLPHVPSTWPGVADSAPAIEARKRHFEAEQRKAEQETGEGVAAAG